MTIRTHLSVRLDAESSISRSKRGYRADDKIIALNRSGIPLEKSKIRRGGGG